MQCVCFPKQIIYTYYTPTCLQKHPHDMNDTQNARTKADDDNRIDFILATTKLW